MILSLEKQLFIWQEDSSLLKETSKLSLYSSIKKTVFLTFLDHKIRWNKKDL